MVDDLSRPRADTSAWQRRLVQAALLIGLAVVIAGFLTSKSLWVPTHTASLQRMLAAVAIALVIGGAAMVATGWARQIFTLAALVLAVAGFGWAGTAVCVFAVLAFAVLGETILPGDDIYETFSLQASIGAGCYVLLFNVLIHFPVNTPLVYGALLAAPLFCLSATRAVVGRLAGSLYGKAPARADIAVATVLFAVVIVNASGAAMPEAEFDALNQHLFIGQEVARLGFWPFDVNNLTLAVMPMGTDWLFGLANMLGGEPAAKMMSVVLFLILVTLVFAVCRRLGADRRAAVLLAALFGSTPITITETYTLFIENGLAIFFLSAFMVLFCYPAAAHRRAVAAAINVGAMAATKALGLALAGPFGLAALFLLRRCSRKQCLWAGGLGGVALILGLLPYVDAAFITGNPVFPFFNGVFRSPFYSQANFHPFAKGDWLPADLFYGATFHSLNYGAGMTDGAFGFQITALFLAAAAAAIVTRSWLALAALAFGTFYMVAIANGVQLGLRYFYPGLPLLVVGLVALFRKEVLPRLVSVVLVASLIAVNLYYYDRAYEPLAAFSWDWLLSPTRWTDMSERHVPDRIMHGLMPLRVLNRRANADGLTSPRVLTPYNIRADLAGTLLAGDWMGPELEDRVSKIKSDDDFRRLVRDFGATHVIVNVADLGRAQFAPYAVKFEPIAQERSWVLYRVPPDLWLGPDLIGQAADFSSPAKGAAQTWQIDGIHPSRLYRLQTTLMCRALDDQFSVSIDFANGGEKKLGGESRQIVCGTAGQTTRVLDVVSPRHSGRARVHFSIDSPGSQGALTAISLREGYPVDDAWHFALRRSGRHPQ